MSSMSHYGMIMPHAINILITINLGNKLMHSHHVNITTEKHIFQIVIGLTNSFTNSQFKAGLFSR